MFNDAEKTFLESQSLARVATVSSDGQVDVAPVGYEFDGVHFFVGGTHMTRTLKYRNVVAGESRVAIVVDGMKSPSKWDPWGVKVHGTAEIVERHGKFAQGPHLKIRPHTHWSWGINAPILKENGKLLPQKSVVWE